MSKIYENEKDERKFSGASVKNIDSRAARKAIIMSEILGRPLANRLKGTHRNNRGAYY